MSARDVARAWLAGMDHVLKCKGCPVCKAPDMPVSPKDEETLEETVKPNYDSPWKDPFGGPK